MKINTLHLLPLKIQHFQSSLFTLYLNVFIEFISVIKIQRRGNLISEKKNKNANNTL